MLPGKSRGSSTLLGCSHLSPKQYNITSNLTWNPKICASLSPFLVGQSWDHAVLDKPICCWVCRESLLSACLLKLRQARPKEYPYKLTSIYTNIIAYLSMYPININLFFYLHGRYARLDWLKRIYFYVCACLCFRSRLAQFHQTDRMSVLYCCWAKRGCTHRR